MTNISPRTMRRDAIQRHADWLHHMEAWHDRRGVPTQTAREMAWLKRNAAADAYLSAVTAD